MIALGTLQLFALAALFFLALGFCVSSLASDAFRARLAVLEPDSRARAWTAIGIAPLVSMVAGVVACVLPSVEAHVLGGHDHCSHHGGHPHLCPWHLVADPGSTVGWLVLFVASVVAAVAVIRAVREITRARRLVRALVPTPRNDVHVLDSAKPFSAAIGLFAPVVVVSHGLQDTLTADELDAALAHERAHASRRDALRLWTIRALWSVVPSALSRTLLTELAHACEEVCDRAGSDAVGDPLVAADAIVKASRAMRPLDVSAAMGLGPTAVDRRVRALLDPPTERSRIGVAAPIALACTMLLFAGPLHHATETLLGFIAH